MTEHFSLQEMIKSSTAERLKIDNRPPPEVMAHLQRSAEGLERIRAAVGGHPIQILSMYRCQALNVAVGGTPASQHVMGQAADIVCPGFGSVHDLALFIFTNAKALGVDQVIKEKNKLGSEWVHVSFSLKPRHQALTIVNGKTLTGIV